MTHRAQPREKNGISQHLRSENVLDDEVVGKAGDGFLRVGKAHRSSDGRVITARASHGGMRRVGGHRGGWRVRVVVRRGSGIFGKIENTSFVFGTPRRNAFLGSLDAQRRAHDTRSTCPPTQRIPS